MQYKTTTTKIAVLAVAALLAAAPISAQKKSYRKAVKIAQPAEDPRITAMRTATQQITFIDSVVVEKERLLSAVRLDPEAGKLAATSQLLRISGAHDGTAFVNGMGDKCYYAAQNPQGLMQLYTCDRLADEWSDVQPLEGIQEGISECNFPFVLADGQTLYFAAKGEESIGGYDIFFTRYDADNGRFLKPENIGMPFNSDANDYLYIIDEISNIGYFASDRRQPEGMVCLYIFIPPVSRHTYDSNAISADQLRGLADIRAIADTWGNGKERKAALQRFKAIGNSKQKNWQPALQFVVNDKVTYTSPGQFVSQESQVLYLELTDKQKKLSDIKAQLEKSRAYYAQISSDADRQILRKEIMDAETTCLQLAADIKKLEKQIRTAENKVINP